MSFSPPIYLSVPGPEWTLLGHFSGPFSVAGLHPRQVWWLLSAQAHLLLLLLLKICGHTIDKVGDRQPWEDHDRLVPDHESGYNGQEEGDFEGVNVLGVHGVVEGQWIVVVVQQDTQPPQLQARLHQHLLAVVAHHEVVVAAWEHPWGRVLAAPFVFRGWFVSHADGIPAGKECISGVQQVSSLMTLLAQSGYLMLRTHKIGTGPVGLSCMKRSTSEPISKKIINSIRVYTVCAECVSVLCTRAFVLVCITA